MRNSNRSTPWFTLLLPLTIAAASSLSEGSTAVDSLKKTAQKDSLTLLQEHARQSSHHSDAIPDPFTIHASTLFAADAPVPSEAIVSSPLCVPVRFGLSNQLNRFLLYGNVAPITLVAANGPLLSSPFDPLHGSDDIFTTEISSIALGPDNVCRYSPYPSATVTPEASIYWENGVFDENVLAFRFARPLSRRLTVSAFSNYRSFAGMRFDHHGNGISAFYKSLVSDTSAISDRGYNPLINDYTSGIKGAWTGNNGSELRLGARYTDGEDERPLDLPPQSSGPVMSSLNRYRTAFNLESSNNRLGPLTLDCEGRIENSDLVKHAPDSAGADKRTDGADRTIMVATRAAIPLGEKACSALVYQFERTARRPFIRDVTMALRQSGAFETHFPLRFGPMDGGLDASAGMIAIDARDTIEFAPSLYASYTAEYRGQRARLYATRSAIAWFIPYDTSFFGVAPNLDRYTLVGGEVEIKNASAGMVIGCQSTAGIEQGTVLMAWPDAQVPYEQSRFAVLVAPRIGPWRGFSVQTRTYVSDKKPFVKALGIVSCTSHPSLTREYIDCSIWFDYWSGRDPVSFAGMTDWNRPVYDIGLDLAAHVGSFRFFGKIGNLLNRNFAYVPGYYSPGLTFRWGFGWYLQK
jgi:hypothetical protein